MTPLMSNPIAFPLAELKDDGRRHVVVDGVEVTVIRRGDRCFALRNQCPHANGRLGDGQIEGDSIVCPLHRWKFDLATGSTKRDRRMKATIHACRIEGDTVFVGGPLPA